MNETDLRAALLLTNRLVELDVRPLAAREFWDLADRVELGSLLHADPASIAESTGFGPDGAARLRALLDAATAMSFAEERLADGGVTLISALDPRFPERLRALGTGCPPFLLVAGPAALLDRRCLAVVGSDDADAPAFDVARQAVALAESAGWTVSSGGGEGFDRAVFDAARTAVVMPAEGILRAARVGALRRRVHAGEVCLISPFAPEARSTTAAAGARWGLIHALADVSLVTHTEPRGALFEAAADAAAARRRPIGVWDGSGRGPGHQSLVARGAVSVSDLSRLLDLELPPPPAEQNGLF